LELGKVLGFCLLAALGAHVRLPIPGTDVPLTLHTLAILLTGFFLAPRSAFSAMVLYGTVGSLLLWFGVAGFSFFSPGSLGLAGPTGGYIVGFAVAAPLISVLAGSYRAGAIRLTLAGLAGMAVLFALGVCWLAVVSGRGLSLAIATGLVPFIWGAAIKLGVAVAIAKTVSGMRSQVPGKNR